MGIRRTLIGLAGIIALVLGLFFSSVMTPKPLSQQQLYELGYFSFDKARKISPFSLVNNSGEAVSLAQFKGQWSLLFFGFTSCPDICPTTLGVLNRAVVELPVKPQVIMVSVDPERDSAAVLNQYVPSFNPEFIGYTGETDQVAQLATELNVAFGKVPGYEPDTYTVDHSATIVVINPAGGYQGFIKSPHQALKITQILNSLM